MRILRSWYPRPMRVINMSATWAVLYLVFMNGSTVSFSISGTTIDIAVPFPQKALVAYLCLWQLVETLLPQPVVNGVHAAVQRVFMATVGTLLVGVAESTGLVDWYRRRKAFVAQSEGKYKEEYKEELEEA